ncbi:cadherin domain-containing protein [Hydrogenophaga taeniospiralis]|uniref:cadherin domain-containing protein n=1 Tax=Hydrogenophaga taeniospiralis TaxID=65656 RepID=UPI001CF9BE80|nr:cadherin domain-containing protein [Hydrogenophaga taeniospiralis]UCU92299.1 cadherin domain-containing protein [Hydrogenophaga taeniospiralis]
MNRIFRSVWSEVTQTYAAVSELAGGRGKRSGSRSAAAVTAQDSLQPPGGRRRLVSMAPTVMRLEPRIVFDGAAIDTALSVYANAEPASQPDATAQSGLDADHATQAAAAAATSTVPSNTTERLADVAGAHAATPSSEVAFVDSALSVYGDAEPASQPDTTSQGALDADQATQAAAAAASTTSSTTTELLADVAATDAAAPRREVAFVDAALRDHQGLVDQISPTVEVVVIAAGQDGLAQMADWAADHIGYDAIHILSHGDAGSLQLGSVRIDSAALESDATVQDQLTRIGAALTASGDLLVYGCRVGADGAFVDRLASLTQADVAASTDLSGASALGGNWTLEAQRGPIELRSLAVSDWEHLLGDPVKLLTLKGTAVGQGLNVSSSAIGSDGSILVTGTVKGTVDFDPGTGVTNLSNTLSDGAVFVAKYSKEGALLWAKAYDGAAPGSDQLSSALAVDAVGNVYVTGKLYGTVDFNGTAAGGMVQGTKDNTDAFVLKLDANGDFQWVNTVGSTDSDSGSALTVGPDGSVYLSGTYYSVQYTSGIKTVTTIRSGAGTKLYTLPYMFGTNPFVAKFNADGSLGWAKAAATNNSGDPRVAQVALTPDGDVFVSGFAFNMTVDGFAIQTGVSASVDFGNGYLWVVGKDGGTKALSALGAVATNSQGIDSTTSIASDTSGNVYIGGHFVGPSADLDPTAGTQAFSSPNALSGYLIKLNADNAFVKAQLVTPSRAGATVQVHKVLTTPTGGLIVAGYETDENRKPWLFVAHFDQDLVQTSYQRVDFAGKQFPSINLDPDGKLSVVVSTETTAEAPLDADPGTGESLVYGGVSRLIPDEDWDLDGFPDDYFLEVPGALVFARWEPDASGLASYGPAITIASSSDMLHAGQTATLSFTLSAEVTDFTAADVSVTGGSLTNFSGSGSTYTATFTPAAGAEGEASVTVAKGAFTDATGRGNVEGRFSQAVDTTPPRATSAGYASNTRVLTLTFDKPISASGVPPASAFTVTSGGQSLAVNGVDEVDGKLVLTLAEAATGASLTVIYTDPTAGDDTNAVQDAVGQDAAAFTRTLSNAAPVVTPGVATPTFTEGGAGIAIDTQLTLADADNATLSSARVAITAGLSAGDALDFVAQNGITGSYDADAGVLALSGTATVAHYQAALRSVTFRHVGDAPTATGTSRTIDWQVTDSGGALAAVDSALASSLLKIAGVNDAAPVLDASASPTLGTITLGTGAPLAGSVPTGAVRLSQIVSLSGTPGNVSDLDMDAPGIAIIGTTAPSNGQLYLSTNGGASWSVLGAVSAESATVLRDTADTWLFFKPGAGVSTTTTVADAITFRAWDGSGAYANGQTGVNVVATMSLLSGGYDSAGSAEAVAVSANGRYVYLADGSKGLQVVDMADPLNPRFVSTLTQPGTMAFTEVVVHGDWAYVANGAGGLVVVDLVDPGAPVVRGTLNTDGAALGMTVVGNTVYLADGARGLKVVDVTNKAAPVQVGSYDTSGTATDVAVRSFTLGNETKTYAYVADGNANVLVVDVSSPATPTLVSTVGLGFLFVATKSVALSADGQTLYVGAGGVGVKVLDLSNPAEPTIPVSGLDTNGTVNDLTLVGSLLYVADDTKGVKVVDVTSPLNPVLLGSLDTPGTGDGVAPLGELMLVADGTTGGLRVVRSAGLGSFSTASDTASVTLRANIAPELDSTAMFTLPTTLETAQAPVNGSTAGSLRVAELLGNAFSDADGDAAGIAVTGVGSQGIVWFSTDGGATWAQLGSVATGTARVLIADDHTHLYFQPLSATGTLASALSFKAWDREGGFSNGQAGVDTRSGTAFGATVAQVEATVQRLDQAPTFEVSPDATRALDQATVGTLVATAVDSRGGQLLLGGVDGSLKLTRLNRDGSPDTAFGEGGTFSIDVASGMVANDLVVTPAGRIVVAVSTPAASGSTANVRLYGLTADGQLDTRFGTAGVQTIDFGQADSGAKLTVDGEGRVVAAVLADFTGVKNSTSTPSRGIGVVRLSASGQWDTSFGVGGKALYRVDGADTRPTGTDTGFPVGDLIGAVLIDANNRVIVATDIAVGNNRSPVVVRLTASGAQDTSFGVNKNGRTGIGSMGNGLHSVAMATNSSGELWLTTVSNDVVGSQFSRYVSVYHFDAQGNIDGNYGGTGTNRNAGVFATLSGRELVAGMSVDEQGNVQIVGSVTVPNAQGWKITELAALSPDATTKSYVTAAGAATLVDAVRTAEGGWLLAGIDSTGQQLASSALPSGNPNGAFGVRVNTLGGTVAHSQITGTPVVLDRDVQLFDRELAADGHYAGLSVTVQRDTGAHAGDLFSLPGTASDGSVSVAGIVVAQSVQEAGRMQITFNANATQTVVNTVLRAITYKNTEAQPPGSVTLAWRVNDGNTGAQGVGGALDGQQGTTTVTITPKPVNTAPVFSSGDLSVDQIGLRFTDDFVDLGNNLQVYGFGLAIYSANAQTGDDGTLDYYLATASLGALAGGTIPVGTGDDVALSVRITQSGVVIAGYSEGEVNEDFSVVRAGASLGEGGDGINFTAVIPVGSGDDRATTVLPLADGRTLLGGTTANPAGDTDFALVMLDATGALDASFGTGGKLVLRLSAQDDRINNLAVDADGRILVVGTSPDAQGKPALTLMRLAANGTPDASFGTGGLLQFQLSPNGSTVGRSVAVDLQGRLLVAGYTVDAQNSADSVVLRLDADGSLDSSFDQAGIKHLVDPGGSEYAGGVDAVLADFSFFGTTFANQGDIVLTSAIVGADGSNAVRITVLTADGSVRSTRELLRNDGSGYLLTVGADGPPTLDTEVTYNQAGSPVRIDATRSVNDANLAAAGSFKGTTLTIERDGAPHADDQFSLIEGSAFTLNEKGYVLYGSALAGQYTQQSGSLTVTFASGTQDKINEFLRDLAYANTGDLSAPQAVTLKTTFNDGNTGAQGSGGALSASMLTTIRVVPPPAGDDTNTSLTLTSATPTVPQLPSTATSAASAVEVLAFSVTDFDGNADKVADAGNSDGLATGIEVVKLTLSSASAANLANVRLQLTGGGLAAPVDGVALGNGVIAFSTPGLSVADSTRADFVVKAWMDGPVDESATVTVSLESDGILTASGSALTASQRVVGTFKPSVQATRLVFDTVLPSTLVNGQGMTGAVVVRAVDAAGNLDVDFGGNVLIGASNGVRVSGHVGSFVFKGVATLSGNLLDGNADHQTTELIASTQGLEAATSSTVTLDIVATRLVAAAALGPFGELSVSGQSTTAQERVINAVDAQGRIDTDFNGDISLVLSTNKQGELPGTVSAFSVASGDTDDSPTSITLKATAGVLRVAAQSFTYTNAGSASEVVLVSAKSSELGSVLLASRYSQVPVPASGPTLSEGTGVTYGWSEAGADMVASGPTAVVPNALVVDATHTTLTSLVATLGGAQLGDRLGLAVAVPDGLTLTGGDTDTLTITGSADLATYQALLRAVTFDHVGDTPGSSNRTVTFTARNAEATSTAFVQTVSVTPGNDAPVITGVPASLSATEDVTAALDLSALIVSDADAMADGQTLALTLTVDAGELMAANGPGVVVSGSGTHQLVLSGAVDRIDAYLNNATNLRFAPEANTWGDVALHLTVTDGVTPALDVGTVQIAVAPVDDASLLLGLPASASESAPELGNAFALDDFTVSDIDSDLLQVTLVASNGTLGGLQDEDAGTAGVQLSGTAASINAALAEATFTATAAGAAGIAVTVSDGTTPVAGTYLLADAIDTNRAPTLAGTAPVGLTTQVAQDLGFVSVADADAGQTLRLSLHATNAKISHLIDEDGLTGGVQISGSVAEINAALAQARLTARSDGDVTLSATLSDGSLSDAQTYTSVAANALPTLTVVSPLAGQEDLAQTIGFAALSEAADEADAGGQVNAFVVQAVSSGTLRIGADAATATDWAAGSNDVIDADHSAFWTPAADAHGTLDAFTVKAQDDAGALSATAVQVQVAAAAVNDAPMLTGTQAFAGISEDLAAGAGVRVSALLSGTASASDLETAGSALGLAVTASTALGQWQVSTDSTDGSDGHWSALGAVSAQAARLLGATDWLRYQPDGLNGETAQLSWRAWDGSTGTAGDTADTVVTGGASAFSGAEITASLVVSEVDDPLILTLSPDAPVDYAENDTQLVDAGLVLTDPDTSMPLDGARAQISRGLVAAEDRLFINGLTSGTLTVGSETISYAYDASTGVMTLTGPASTAAFEQALRSVAYQNLSDNPTTTARDITLTASTMLAVEIGGTPHYYEYVRADGSTGLPRLGWAQARDAAAARHFAGMTGYLVSITSAAENAFLSTSLPGSAWIGASDAATEGVWQWVTGPEAGTVFWNGGPGGSAPAGAYANWQGSDPNNFDWNGILVADDGEDYAQIVPSGSGQWNDIDAPGRTVLFTSYEVDGYLVEYTGVTVPFFKTVSLTPQARNDAPVMTSASPVFNPTFTVNENEAASETRTVANLVGATISDVDSGAVEGIAITATSAAHGSWQYRIDNAGDWLDVGAVGDEAALLLRAADGIHFVPDARNGGTATFSYRAWDQSAGTAHTTTDTSATGGTSAFSSQVNSASITVTAVNDAPFTVSTGAMALLDINEDVAASDNPGQRIRALIAQEAAIGDVDTVATLGLAIVGKTVAGSGDWEYSTDSGLTWSSLGAVSDGTARLLRAHDYVRFAPDGQSGGTATLSVRVWDQTSGSAGSTANLSNVASRGGTTAYSLATSTVSVQVTTSNDAPVLATSGGAATYAEQAGAASAIDAGLTVSDDSATLTQAMVRVTAGYTDGDTLAFTAQAGITGHWDAASATLSLSGTATPDQWQAALRSVVFSSTSDDPTRLSTSRTLAWQTTDAEGLLSNQPTRTLSLSAVADRATLTGAPANFAYTEDDGARVLAPALVIADSDDIALASARVTLSPSASGFVAGSERLGLADASLMAFSGDDWSATVGAIGLSYTASTGVLALSGTASVTEYQQLLRSVTYLNAQDYRVGGAVLAGNASRTVSWQVTDANSDGASATTSLVASTAIDLQDAREIPQVAGANAAVVNYPENGEPVALAPGLTASDNGGGNTGTLAGAVVRIGSGFTEGDTLSWTAVSGINGSWDAALGALTLTGSASVADYETALRSVAFASSSDAPTGSSASRTVHWQISDDIGIPSQVDAGATTTVALSASNDAATFSGTDPVTFTEGGAAVKIAAALRLADVDDTRLTQAQVVLGGSAGFAADNEVLLLDGITATTGSMAEGQDWTVANVAGSGVAAQYDAATGTLSLSGSASLAQYEALLQRVAYRSDAVDPTATLPTRTLAWHVTEAGAGGSATALGSTTVAIFATNQAAALAGLSTGPVAVTEGVAALPGASVTLSDADDTHLASARVWISGGLSTGDELAFVDASGIAGQWDATTGTLALRGAATVAQYEAALRSVTFLAGDDATAVTPSRVISWSVTDANSDGAGAATSATATVSLSLTATTDAPVLVTLGAAYTEGTAAITLDAQLGLSDADDAELSSASVTISTGLIAGDQLALSKAITAPLGLSSSWNAGTGVLTVTGTASVAAYRDALRAVSFRHLGDDPTAAGTQTTRTLTWAVTDANSDALGAATGTATSVLNLNAVNDTAALSGGGTLVFTEGDAPTVLDDGITLSDADDTQMAGATLTISNGYIAGDALDFAEQNGISGSWNAATGVLTLSGTASVAQYQEALRSVTFVSTSDDPTATSATRQVSIQVTDADAAGVGAALSNTTSSAVTLSATADAPVSSGLATKLSWIEGQSALELAPELVLVDADDSQLSAATVRIGNRQAGDALTWDATVLATTAISADWSADTGLLRLSGTDSVAAYQAVLRTVRFLNTATDPTAGGAASSRTIGWQVTDGNGDSAGAASSSTVTTTLSIAGVNSAPTLATQSASTNWREGDGAVRANTLLSLSDIDSPMLSGANVRISAGYTDGDQLSFTTVHGITASWDTATGTLALSGDATIGQYQDALRTVMFDSPSEHPTASAATRTLSWSVTDQDVRAPATSAVGTSTLVIEGANDAPTLSAFSDAVASGAEDSAIAISLADLLSGGNEADVDGSVTAMRVAAVASGTLRIGDSAGTATDWVAGSNDTVDASNGAWWTPDANANSFNHSNAPIAAFSVQAVDDQGSISATARAVTVDVTRVHDTAVVTSVAAPAAGTYAAGEMMDFTVRFDRAVTVNTAGGTPQLQVTVGSTPVQALYVAGSGTTELTFRHTVAAGEFDNDGVAMAPAIDTAGGTLSNVDDGESAAATLALAQVASTVAVQVDGMEPTVLSSASTSLVNASQTNASFTVTLSEAVKGMDLSDFALTALGTASGKLQSVSAVDPVDGLASQYTVTVGELAGTGSVRLDVKALSTGITDAAGNPLGAFTSGTPLAVDTDAPSLVFDTLATDGVLNAAQAASGLVLSGLSAGIDDGLSVSIRVGLTDYMATVQEGRWSVRLDAADVQAWDQGNLTLTARGSDAAGNASEAQTLLRVDTEAPMVTIAKVATDDVVNAAEAQAAGGVVVSGTATAENGQTLSVYLGAAQRTVTVEAGQWQASFAAADLIDGSLQVSAVVDDTAGNTGSAQASLVVDRDAGAITLAAVSGDNLLDATEANAAVTLTGSAADLEDGQLLTVLVGDLTRTVTVAQGAWSLTLLAAEVQALSEGSVAVDVTGQDAAGNTATAAQAIWILDRTSPVLTLDAVTGDGTINLAEHQGGFVLSGTSSEGSAVVIDIGEAKGIPCIVDSFGNWSTWISTAQLPDVSAISVAVTVRVSDAAGNSTTLERTVGMDAIAPLTPTLALMSDTGIRSDDRLSRLGQLKVASEQGARMLWSVNGELTDNVEAALRSGSNTVTARQIDSAGNASATSQTLFVTFDASAPVIESAQQVAVDENQPAGTPIYAAQASDASEVTYSLLAGAGDADQLTVDALSGAVSLRSGVVDHDLGQRSYRFVLVATDAAGNASQQSVNVLINNLDEVAPAFTSDLVANALDENSGADQVIYTATSTDTADVASGSTRYSLKAVDDHEAFSIDSATGEVTLTGNPDHETQASYSFTVIATDEASNTSEQAVSLAINDLDEMAPTITSSAAAVAIDENSGTGQVVYTTTSTDTADVAIGSTRYSLKAVDDHEAFSIDGATGEVTLTGNPDHETQASYSFTVIATDEASNASEQAVNLAINDLDEVAPAFTSDPMVNALDENSGAGQVIYTATSTDTADVASGSTRYSLKAVDDHEAFSIDGATGEVTLTGNPDHESQASYSFTVIATDEASNASEQAVSLAINDLDEVAPAFTSDPMVNALDENSGTGQVIYTATSTDTADVAIGSTRYSLKAVDDHEAFSIDGATGEVTLTGNPDHETQASYSFTVIATDEASNTSEQAVSLAINDLDEVAPTINSSAAAAAIDENRGTGQVIYTTTSTDTADVASGSTRYSLKAVDDHEAFSIDGATGEVTLTGNPDHETQASYSFTVIATDEASNASEQAVSLAINDLDEVAPAFTSDPMVNALDENSGAGQVIYTATSNDTADIASGSTRYSLKAVDDHEALSIDGATGEVTLTGNPDHETQASYSFTVIATDEASNTSEQAVSLRVLNVNDNAPKLVQVTDSVELAEDADAGEIDATVLLASDADGDVPVFSLLQPPTDGLGRPLFEIDALTGKIRLTAAGAAVIDFESGTQHYNLTVRVSDGVDGHAQQRNVRVQLLNVSEFQAPVQLAAAVHEQPVQLQTPLLAAPPVAPAVPVVLSEGRVFEPMTTYVPTPQVQEQMPGPESRLFTNGSGLLLQRDLSLQIFSVDAGELRFTIPADTFGHNDPTASFTLSAVLYNGAPLPAWLKFDPIKGEFSGVPPEGYQGELVVKLIATDSEGRQIETLVRIRIGVNGAAAEKAVKLQKGERLALQGKPGLSAQLRGGSVFAWKAERDRALHQAREAALTHPATALERNAIDARS